MFKKYICLLMFMGNSLLSMENAITNQSMTALQRRHEQLYRYVKQMKDLRIYFGTAGESVELIVKSYNDACNDALQGLCPGQYNKIEVFKNKLTAGVFLVDLDSFPEIARKIGEKEGLIWEIVEAINFIHTQLHILYVLPHLNAKQTLKKLTWLDHFIEKYPLLKIPDWNKNQS